MFHLRQLLTSLLGMVLASRPAAPKASVRHVYVPDPNITLPSDEPGPFHIRRRGKGKGISHRPSGAAAIKRAARKRRNVRARAPKRKRPARTRRV